MSQEEAFRPGDKRPRDEEDEVNVRAVVLHEAGSEEENGGDDAEARAFELVFEAHGHLLWGSPQRALELYNQSFQIAALPITFYARGLAKFLLGNLDESLADVQTAIDRAECQEARTFWVSEKIAMCGAVGNYQEVRRLSRNYPLENDPIKGYLELKSLVCLDDVSWEDVKVEARRFFESFSQYTQTKREVFSKQFSSAIKLLKKFSITLSEAESAEVVSLIKTELLQNINRILDDHIVEDEDQFFLKELWLECSLKSYLCGFSGIRLVQTDPEFCAMAERVRGITFQDTDTLPPDFLEILLKMPLLQGSNEDEEQTPPEEYTAEEIEGFIQQTKRYSKMGSIPQVYAQIKNSYDDLLYRRAADDERPDWRALNWSEFFHSLPEFTGKDYRELFISLRHELLIAQMTSEKTKYLDVKGLVEEHENIAQMSTVLFDRYNECKIFMQGRNPVAQRVSRNSYLAFQYELLDEFLALLLDAVKKIFNLKQLNTLELIRRMLVLSKQASDELRSLLSNIDLKKALLWDDNVSPQKVKDFSHAFHRHMDVFEKFRDFELKIREQEELARSSALTLLYGKNNFAKKKTVIAVPFTPTLSLASLPRVYDEQKVDSAKNLMVGFVFTVTFSADCDGDRKYYVRHIPIRMSQSMEFLKYDTVGQECEKSKDVQNNVVLENIRNGFEIFQGAKQNPAATEKRLLAFSPFQQEGLLRAKHSEFQPLYHSHSEQSGVFWLDQKCDEVAAELIQKLKVDPDFQRNGKLGAIAIDMLSDKSSCDPCKLSILVLQASAGEESFRMRIEKKFREAQINVAKSGLKINSRIFSRQPYCYDDPKKGDTQKGVNPVEKNVKHLNNLGIFQLSHPGTAVMSGSNPQSNSSYRKT
ncbi:MAG: hypothetical protein SFW07_01110 [Gammaproteobacteria bacterium]|nr:hypothetical protein [Gammaproteobacteria bacterium]